MLTTKATDGLDSNDNTLTNVLQRGNTKRNNICFDWVVTTTFDPSVEACTYIRDIDVRYLLPEAIPERRIASMCYSISLQSRPWMRSVVVANTYTTIRQIEDAMSYSYHFAFW